MNNLLFKKRNVSKFDYEIKVHHLTKLPKSGIILYMTWHRGKKHNGETKKTFVKDKIALWEESFTFRGTLFKNSKGKYKTKYINLCFHEVLKDKRSSSSSSSQNNSPTTASSSSAGHSQHGGGVSSAINAAIGSFNHHAKDTIGEIKINLADFSPLQQQSDVFASTKTLPVSLWNTSEVQFKFTIKSTLRKSGAGNGLDTVLSEATTMTDASDDEDEDGGGDDPFGEDGGSSRSSGQFSALSSAAHRNYMERRKTLQQKLRTLRTDDGDDDESMGGGGGGLSDDDDDTGSSRLSSNRASNGLGGAVIDKRRVAQLRRRDGKHRRQNSFSMDEEADAFSTAIQSAEEGSKLQANNRRATSDLGTDEDLSSTSQNSAVQKAKEKISIQEQKMRQMQEEILRLQKETNERTVIDSIINNRLPEFCENLPLAAPIIFKVLQHWDCFSTNKSTFPNKICSSIRTIVDNNTDNNDLLCYWLSNCCIMLNLLQKEYPVSLDHDSREDDHSVMRVKIPDDSNSSVSQTQTTTSTHTTKTSVGDNDEFTFESPIAKFKRDVISLSIRIYSILIENIYKALISVLIPGMFQTSPANGGRAVDPKQITAILHQYHQMLKKNFFFNELIAQFYAQIYLFINAHTFNALFDTQKKRCKMGSAIMLKMGVSELEMWAESHHLGNKCKENLGALRQASDIMIMNKASLVDESTRREVCPTLTLVQVRKILQSYQPDEYDPDIVPSSVLKALPAADAKKGTQDKQEIDESILIRPTFDLDHEIPDWKKVKTSKINGEAFSFLN